MAGAKITCADLGRSKRFIAHSRMCSNPRSPAAQEAISEFLWAALPLVGWPRSVQARRTRYDAGVR
jgi:hypothetical protein